MKNAVETLRTRKATNISIVKWAVIVLISFCALGVILLNFEIIKFSTSDSVVNIPLNPIPKATVVPFIPIDPAISAKIKRNTPNFEYSDPTVRQPIAQRLRGEKECNIDPMFSLLHDHPKPEFCMIGVAKGGSTSFSNYLPAHPNVKGVKVKEPNFWSWKYMPTDFYQDMFSNIDPIQGAIEVNSEEQISGEYSTSYILHPLVPRKMYTQLPKLKIILFLRNPIDRAYSHFTMQMRGRIETNSFEYVIAKELEEIDALRQQFRKCFVARSCNETLCLPAKPMYRHDKESSTYILGDNVDLKDYFFTSYLFRSIYDDPVERWLSIYPREQIKIISSEYFYANTSQAMNEITEFLNLPPHDFSTDDVLNQTWGGGPSNRYESPHDYMPLQNKTRETLQKFFAPYNQRLFGLIGQSFNW